MNVTRESILFRSITVITPDSSDGVIQIPSAHVAVSNGVIRYIGDDESAAVTAIGGRNFSVYNGQDRLLMPAFANAHAHTPMVLMRNAADDMNLHKWLFDAIFPMEARMRKEDIRIGSLLGMAEMIRSGIGACADMYYHVDAVLESALESGMRMLLSCEAKEADPISGKNRIRPDQLEAFMHVCRDSGEGRIKPSLMVHSVYLYEEELYPQLAGMAKDYDMPIQIHVSETQREVDECFDKYGCSPVKKLDDMGLFGTSAIAAHAVHMCPGDLEILSGRSVTISHNPSSNIKLGSGMADVPAMLRHQIPVALGTDGAASNNALDLFREMLMASFTAKCRSMDASALPAPAVLRMATRTGMMAMGFSQAGQIKAGASADLQVLNLDDLSLVPRGNLVSAMVYSGSPRQVESVMVDGRFLMKNHELTTIDEERLRFDAQKASNHVTGLSL